MGRTETTSTLGQMWSLYEEYTSLKARCPAQASAPWTLAWARQTPFPGPACVWIAQATPPAFQSWLVLWMTVTSWTVTVLGWGGHSHKEQSAVTCLFPGTAFPWCPHTFPLFWLTQKNRFGKELGIPLQPGTRLFKSECQGWASWGLCVCWRHSGCAQALHLGI